jgi:predicted TIM-barrel fold metal-dependent hydrolase
MNAHDPFQAAALTGGPPTPEIVVDVHGHCAGLEEPAQALPRAWPLSARRLIAALDRCGIRHLLFSHFDALRATTPEALRAAQDDTTRIVAATGGRLLAHLVLHPWLPVESLRQLATDSVGQVCVGAKVHGELHDTRAASPRLAPLLTRAEDLGLTVLLHVHPADGAGDIDRLAARHPRLNFILAHLWPRLDSARALFSAHPNLFTDTSLSAGPPGAVERLVEAVGEDRVIFGSDASYLSPGAQFAKVACANLPLSTKRRLFSSNALAALPLLARRVTFSAPS